MAGEIIITILVAAIIHLALYVPTHLAKYLHFECITSLNPYISLMRQVLNLVL